jgi:hypothetical protein
MVIAKVHSIKYSEEITADHPANRVVNFRLHPDIHSAGHIPFLTPPSPFFASLSDILSHTFDFRPIR